MKYKFEMVVGDDEQVKILYELLKKRIHKISHKDLPEYNKHKQFVIHNPYIYWYLINHNGKYLGSFYIKEDNSIGLNINEINMSVVLSCINFIKENFKPNPPEASMITNYFYINVATSNKELIDIMKVINVPKLQISYKI